MSEKKTISRFFSGKQYTKCSPSGDDEIEKERERGSVYERM